MRGDASWADESIVLKRFGDRTLLRWSCVAPKKVAPIGHAADSDGLTPGESPLVVKSVFGTGGHIITIQQFDRISQGVTDSKRRSVRSPTTACATHPSHWCYSNFSRRGGFRRPIAESERSVGEIVDRSKFASAPSAETK
jgi:hypothetical protein